MNQNNNPSPINLLQNWGMLNMMNSQNNQWNYDSSNSYQYNPSTKVLKAGSFSLGGNCTLQYDSTNQCVNFVFA